MNRFSLIALLGSLLMTGCSFGSSTRAGAGDDGDDDAAAVSGEPDPFAVTIEIQSPERGTLSDASEVVVAGRASSTDSSISDVTVNGTTAQVAGDGSFQATIPLVEGITLIETEARDASGNSSTDARAVMAGTLVDQATPVAEGVVANLSGQAMSGLSGMVADLANGTDFTALAATLNPVVDTGDGCNSAKVFIESVQHAGIEVGVGAVVGGIDAAITVRSLVVTGQVNFRAVCIGGSASFTMTADAYDVGGVIVPSLSGGDITVSLDGVTSAFTGFNIDVGGVPGFVESLFEGQVRDRVAEILRDQIAQMVPPVANSFLADFLATSYDVSLLGQTISLSIAPSAMDWNEQGGTIVLDTSATVAGVSGGLYLSSPLPRPSAADLASTGIRVGVADDVLNQLLAAIWSSGALEQTMLPLPGDALSAAFGGDVASAELTLFLPPAASFDTATGTARLTVGDLLLEAVNPAGDVIASFVLSADIDLAVETSSDGRVKIITRAPRILAQVLSQSDSLAVPLTGDTVAAIAELAIAQLSVVADDLLGNLPIPGIADATIASPTFQPVGGYLLLGGTITFE